MTTYTWTEIRDNAVKLFAGETPGAELEQSVITEFANDPEKVITTISQVAKRRKQGKIKSCWAVVRAELAARPVVDVEVTVPGGEPGYQSPDPEIPTDPLERRRIANQVREAIGLKTLTPPDDWNLDA